MVSDHEWRASRGHLLPSFLELGKTVNLYPGTGLKKQVVEACRGYGNAVLVPLTKRSETGEIVYELAQYPENKQTVEESKPETDLVESHWKPHDENV